MSPRNAVVPIKDGDKEHDDSEFDNENKGEILTSGEEIPQKVNKDKPIPPIFKRRFCKICRFLCYKSSRDTRTCSEFFFPQYLKAKK